MSKIEQNCGSFPILSRHSSHIRFHIVISRRVLSSRAGLFYQNHPVTIQWKGT